MLVLVLVLVLVVVLLLLLWDWRLVVCEKKGNRERHYMSLFQRSSCFPSRKKNPDKLLAPASMGSNGSIV